MPSSLAPTQVRKHCRQSTFAMLGSIDNRYCKIEGESHVMRRDVNACVYATHKVTSRPAEMGGEASFS